MQIGYLANRSKLRVEKEGDDHDDDYKDWNALQWKYCCSTDIGHAPFKILVADWLRAMVT